MTVDEDARVKRRRLLSVDRWMGGWVRRWKKSWEEEGQKFESVRVEILRRE